MANLPALVVITLLQLCRAEILERLSETWYSANVINDGFQPKSISEIFSTETSFSTTNPIIVLPTSSVPSTLTVLSTYAPPTQPGSSTLTDVTNVSVTPISPSTFPPTSSYIPRNQTHTTIYQPIETSSPATPIVTPEQRTTLMVQQTSSQLPLQQARFDIAPQNPSQPPTIQSNLPVETNPSTVLPQLSREPLSNYFLIYQQAPQNIQTFTPPVQTSGLRSEVVDNSGANIPRANPVDPLNLTSQPTTITISTTQSPITSSLPSITSTTATVSWSTEPPSTVRTVSIPASSQTFSTARVTNTTRGTLCPPRQGALSMTPSPNIPLPAALYPLRIRVVAPTGSITNVNINPATTATTTTTRRPTTTRAKRVTKPKRNTYDRCINSCRGNKDPICTIPLGSSPIDPSTLKGFPSVCHMACHNSYRKDPYEKILDGRCGRLRTRIQSVGNNNKLTRVELNKAQYTIESTGPQTVLEFSRTLR